MAPQSERHCQIELSWEMCKEETLCLMKNTRARLMFGRGNVDNAQDFLVFGQMGLNSSTAALAPIPSAAFTIVFPVFQGIQTPIGLKFVITDTWNQTKLDVFTHYQLPSKGVYFLKNKCSNNVDSLRHIRLKITHI